MKKKKNRHHQLVPIVRDGAIGHPDIGDGRIIPVLIIDCSNHQALYDLIVLHASTPPGDVVSKWSWEQVLGILLKKRVFLNLEFKRPVETTATFCFDVLEQGILVDFIMNARGVYLQPTKSGTTVIEGFEQPKILVEVSASINSACWEKIYRASLVKKFRQHGFSRAQAQEATTQELAARRIFCAMRPKAKMESDSV
jgi:hypothetical protein